MSTKHPDTYGRFLASYLKELVDTPDAEILASEKVATPSDFGVKLLGKAKAEAARRRLKRAKAGVATRDRVTVAVKPTLTPAAARAFLAKYANDSRLTLAARNLEELSDEDLIRLGQQLQQLEDADQKSGKDDV
jgi:hypothetical protein